MPLSPDDFYAHAVAAADDERRLPLARMTGWDISPFEAAGLRVSSFDRPSFRSRLGTARTPPTAAPAGDATTASGSTTAGG